MGEKRLILTSYGLTTKIGRMLIGKELEQDDLRGKKIFLFHEPHYSIERMLVSACLAMGFERENIILSGQQKSNQEVEACEYLYCTEGNTFEVLALLRERDLDQAFVRAFERGATYIGASAGALIAGVSVEPARDFDRNFVRMWDFRGLGLFDGVVVPHFTEEELREYVEKMPELREKYGKVYAVANDGVLVMDGNTDTMAITN